LRALFANLRARLVLLVEAISAQPVADDACPRHRVPEDKQLAFGLEVNPMQLYFIRHGQSANNALYDRTGSWSGRSHDPELTDIGKRQAEYLARFLRQANPGASTNGWDPHNVSGFDITHLYTSLMMRAVQTGSIVAEALGRVKVLRGVAGPVKSMKPLFVPPFAPGRTPLTSAVSETAAKEGFPAALPCSTVVVVPWLANWALASVAVVQVGAALSFTAVTNWLVQLPTPE